MKRIRVLIENWKRESRLSLTLSQEDPSEYADGYARAMSNCAIRLEELIFDMGTPDPHELWAAAQLMPGEGIEDGVKRIEELLGSNVEMAERAWESYNKLKAEGKIPADLDCGTTTSGVKVRHRTGQQWREYER